MRRQVLLIMVACGLAGCGGNESSAESEATNATLLNEATVNALLGSDIPVEELPTTGNAIQNALLDNETDAPANETD